MYRERMIWPETEAGEECAMHRIDAEYRDI